MSAIRIRFRDCKSFSKRRKVCNRNLKAHWDSKNCTAKAKKIIKKHKGFVRNREKSTQLLYDISPSK